MAKKASENLPKETDVVKDQKLTEILGGFINFRYEMNACNALLRRRWLRSIGHYTISISVLHSRLNRGSVRPKTEAIILMQGRLTPGRLNNICQELIDEGFIEERPLAGDKRKKGYWATDLLVEEAFGYLLTAWEINYNNEESMKYFNGLTNDMRYLFETEEGQRVRAAYSLVKHED